MKKQIFKIFQTDTDSYPIRVTLTNNAKDLKKGDTIMCRACGVFFINDGSLPFHCQSCQEEWMLDAIELAKLL